MAQILREQGPYAALAAIRDLMAALVPPWQREPSDPWRDSAVTMAFGRPAWLS